MTVLACQWILLMVMALLVLKGCWRRCAREKRRFHWVPELGVGEFSRAPPSPLPPPPHTHTLEGQAPCSRLIGEARKREGRGSSVSTETRFPGGHHKPAGAGLRACSDAARQGGGCSGSGRGCRSAASWPLSCPWSVLVRRERYSTHSIIKYSQAKPCLDLHFWITDLLMGWLRELNHLVFGKIGNV